MSTNKFSPIGPAVWPAIRIMQHIYTNVLFYYMDIYFACLGVCLFFLFVFEPIGPTFFCETLRNPREGLWMIEFSKIYQKQNSDFWKFKNPRFFFIKSAKFCFGFVLQCIQRKCLQIIWKIGAKHSKSLVINGEEQYRNLVT